MPKITLIEKNEATDTAIPEAPLYALSYNKAGALSDVGFVSDLKSITELPGVAFGAANFGELRPRSREDIPRLTQAAKDAGIRFNYPVGIDGQRLHIRTITVFPIMKIPGKISETGYKFAIINGEVIPYSEAGAYMAAWAEENGFDYARTWFRDKR